MSSLAALLLWLWECPPGSPHIQMILRTLRRADEWRWSAKLIPSYDE